MLSCPRCVVLRPASYHVLQQELIYWYVLQTLKYLLHFFAYISVKSNLKYKPFRIFFLQVIYLRAFWRSSPFWWRWLFESETGSVLFHSSVSLAIVTVVMLNVSNHSLKSNRRCQINIVEQEVGYNILPIVLCSKI